MTAKYKVMDTEQFKNETIDIYNQMMDVKIKKIQSYIDNGFDPAKIPNFDSALIGLQLSKFIEMIAMLNNQSWAETKNNVVGFIAETLIPVNKTPMPDEMTH